MTDKPKKKPIARSTKADGPAQADNLPNVIAPGSLAWAAIQIEGGRSVRRRAWTGNKAVSAGHVSGRVILENDDLVATDWELV